MGRGRKKRQASGSPTTALKPQLKMSKKGGSESPIPEMKDNDIDTPSWAVSLHEKMDSLTTEVQAIRSNITSINHEIKGIKDKQLNTETRIDQLEGTIYMI